MNSPKLARFILEAMLPREMRDAAVGDLEEGYALASSPRLWYWRQVAASVIPAMRMRWRSPGVMRIGTAAVASYIVVVALAAILFPIAGALWPGQGSTFWAFQIGGDMIAGLVGGVVIATLVPMAPLRAAGLFAFILALLLGVSVWMDYGKVPVWYHGLQVLTGPGCVMLSALICAGAGKRSRRS